MTPDGERLLAAIDAALRGAPSTPHPAPWLGWLTLALCRQRARQRWLAEIARTRLARSDDYDGEVPGLPEWSYHFHGRGLCLTGPNNEIIDADFFQGDDDYQTIDLYFFANRVESLLKRPFVEAQLQAWFGGGTTLMMLAIEDLRELGIVTPPEPYRAIRLNDELEARHQEIAQLSFEAEATQADWKQRLGDELQSSKAQHQAWCRSLLDDRKKSKVIGELAEILPADLIEAACYQLLLGPVDFTTGKAIEALTAIGSRPSAQALKLSARMDPAEHNPYSACRLAEWLFIHKVYEREALALLQRFAAARKIKGFHGNPFDFEYAALTLRFAPEAAPPLVRQALRSKTPDSFKKMAALLSVLDEPWCHKALLDAAQSELDDQNKRFLLSCLMRSSREGAQVIADALMPAPIEVKPNAIGYTFAEVEFFNLRENVEFYREEMRHVAMRIRPN